MNNRVYQTNAEGLARLFSLEEPAGGTWGEQDLPGMLQHQLSAPLAFDLNALNLNPTASRVRDETLTSAAGREMRTFGDLLFGKDPLPAALRLSKEFFKRRTKEYSKNSAEWRLAYLFYLLSILAAGSRWNEISNLTKPELLKAIAWAESQKWLDAKTRDRLKASKGLGA